MPLRPYLVFFGYNNDARGGMLDFMSDHETEESARACCTALTTKHNRDSWAHFYDPYKNQVVTYRDGKAQLLKSLAEIAG